MRAGQRFPPWRWICSAGFGGARAPTLLRRIADDRDLPDIVRWGARRRAGWPDHGEAKRRLAFLDTLADPDDTLVEAAEQGAVGPVPDGAVFTEVLRYLEVLPSDRRRRVVEGIARAVGRPAAWLLHAVLHLDDPPLQRLALRELARLRPPGVAEAIGRLARTARTAALRREATAAARRLSLQVVGRDRVEAPLPLPPIEGAWLSMVDGDGGQAAAVLRRLAEGMYVFAHVFHKDGWGIKDAFGSTRATRDEVDDILDGFGRGGVHLVAVELAAVRGALALAVDVNAATGHGIPPVYELWEPLLHERYPPEAEPPLVLELEDAPFASHADLLRAGGELAAHPFFNSWAFESARVAAATALAPPPGRSGLDPRQYRPMIGFLLDGPTRARLRRQAWLLDRAGDPAARDAALALAAQVAAAPADELAQGRFWQVLLGRGVVQLYAEFIGMPRRRRRPWRSAPAADFALPAVSPAPSPRQA